MQKVTKKQTWNRETKEKEASAHKKTKKLAKSFRFQPKNLNNHINLHGQNIYYTQIILKKV